MKVKSKIEIDAEIKRLKALAPVGEFDEIMRHRIQLAIDILSGKKPMLVTPTDRELGAEVWRWKENTDPSALPPSSGWQAFVRP